MSWSDGSAPAALPRRAGGCRTRRRCRRLRAGSLGVLASGLAVALAVTAPASAGAAASAGTAGAAGTRPFSADSPFNQRIPPAPRLDPSSAAMVAYASRTRQLNVNLYAYGIPVYEAGASSPRYRVTCTMSGAWGACPLGSSPRPIPVGAVPSTGSDGAMVVVDPTDGHVDEYWRARRSGDSWSASWGAVNQVSGSGWGGGSTGAGASRLAGVVRVSEITAGVIDHALVLQSDNVCRGTVRAPALKTDGTSDRADCVPEGARLQLDPALELASLRSLTPAERTVAKALQEYGGYVIDTAGTALSVSFERAPDATGTSPGSAYLRAGLPWDYYGLPDVPWQRLRVLRTWNG